MKSLQFLQNRKTVSEIFLAFIEGGKPMIKISEVSFKSYTYLHNAMLTLKKNSLKFFDGRFKTV